MKTPLMKTLEALKEENRISFHTPGHKKGWAYESSGDGGLKENLYQYDTTEIFGTDQLQDPIGVLKESQQWTAEVFHGHRAYYLINGSSAGILGMLLSQTKPGDEILLPRDVHQSVIHALILGDIRPRFIQPEIDPLLKIPRGIRAYQVQEGFKKYPRCKGVLLTHPNYYGHPGEILEIRRLTHSLEKFFWVDQAHGAHLGLHQELPPSAVEVGVDLTVMSFHKTLPTMTQSGVLFAKGPRVDHHRLLEQLNIHQSTSPSYVLMASIEQGTRHYLQFGKEKMKELLTWVEDFEGKFQNLTFFQLDTTKGKDRTKLWIHTENSGLTGYEVEAYLRKNHGMDLEFAMPQGILALSSMGNRKKDFEKLYLAFEELDKTLYNRGKRENCRKKPAQEGFYYVHGENEKDVPLGLPIRTAFYCAKERVSINKSLNRVAGSAITPYPPGVPLILPGEVITQGLRNKLLEIAKNNPKVMGIQEGKIMVVIEE